MPSPALLQTSSITASPTIILSGTQTLTGAGGGGATVVVFSNRHQGTWTRWNEEYSTTSLTSGDPVTAIAITGEGAGGTASDRIWVRWNQDYTTNATAEVVGAQVRVTNATAAVTTVTIDPWPAWNATYVRERQISDEEAQAGLRRLEGDRLEREARWKAEQLEREQANQRANLLLRENLTPEQQAELADKQYFTLKTVRPDGEERFYRIHRGRSHNIERVDASGRRIRRYCMHPVIQCPDADTMLTQKLWLQDAALEEQLLRQANQS